MLNIAVLGANGRMGRSLIAEITASEDLKLSGALVEPGAAEIGRDAAENAGLASIGVGLTDEAERALKGAQLAIDFTLPGAVEANLAACRERGVGMVIGTTGLAANQEQLLAKAAQDIPIVYARNMSVGVNVFMELIGRASRVLGDDYDVEIFEAHHRNKVDAPSGTALALGERIAAEKGRALDTVAVRGRDGQTGPREAGTIGFSVVRGGNIVGDHTVFFVSDDERLEFTHRAQDRKTFARGALRAARWLADRNPGLYSMADVLGF